MIVRKLRKKSNWTQEQLATMSGLSIRTIQRVESGRSASLETLKCLASVFETDISKLTEEITVIDKQTEIWAIQPRWFRWGFWKIRSRRVQLRIELFSLTIGVLIWLVGYFSGGFMLPIGEIEFVGTGRVLGPMLILSAYYTGWTIRHGDREQLW